jgi:hypothetical protein
VALTKAIQAGAEALITHPQHTTAATEGAGFRLLSRGSRPWRRRDRHELNTIRLDSVCRFTGASIPEPFLRVPS